PVPARGFRGTGSAGAVPPGYGGGRPQRQAARLCGAGRDAAASDPAGLYRRVESGAPLAIWQRVPQAASRTLEALQTVADVPLRPFPTSAEIEARLAACADRCAESPRCRPVMALTPFPSPTLRERGASYSLPSQAEGWGSARQWHFARGRRGNMLTREQIAFYEENGFLVVEDIIPQADIARAREVVEEFVERSRAVSHHDAVYDLEPGHSAEQPRVRRLKDPCSLDPIFQKIGFSDAVLDCVAALIGPGIRYQASKLNLKSAAFGSPVEWHQD